MMKIGLLGGSFNPPHQGHIYISRLAIKKLGLNQLWWIPNQSNPLKKWVVFDDFESRFEQCQKITEGHPKIRVKNFRDSSIYTVELLAKLKSCHKNQQFYWIMGADNFATLHRWKHFNKLIKMVVFVVFSRQNFLSTCQKSKAYQIYKNFLKNSLNCHLDNSKVQGQGLPKFLIFRTKNLDISSTKMREKNV